MRLPGSLVGRITLAAVAAVGVALGVAGVTVVVAAARSDRDALDRELTRLVQSRAGPALRVLGPGGRFGPDAPGGPLGGPGGGPPGVVHADEPPPPLDPGSDRFVRAIAPDGRETSAGAPVPENFPVPSPGDPVTVSAGGQDWRTVTRAVRRGGILQVAARLEPLQARERRLRRIVLLVALGALAITALAATGLVRLALAPLARLRAAAGRVAETADLGVRVPSSDGPDEVRELAGDFNAMLERLGAAAAEREAALAAARRFAADAGHELRTPLTSLTANLSSLEPATREDARARQALDATERDTRRLGGLVEQLQALARGEAGPPARAEEVDLAELLDGAVAALRQRHPGIEATLNAPEPGPSVTGDPEGLRILADNLLENAARHGRPDGRVTAAVGPGDDGVVVLSVDDDGPGVPAGEREAVLGRFVRGRDARGAGSGLGLAIAAAQAQRHGGRLRLEASPLGGTRAVAELRGS